MNSGEKLYKMLTRKEKQFLFAELMPHLILYMIQRGYKPVIGFCFRCKDCPVGEERSLHKICLAIDVELHDKDGNYLTDTESHKEFGEFWERLHPLCRWGGRFDDGNHYSIYHRGMK
jgi:hypothetical protein